MTGNLQEVLDLRRWREAGFAPADQALLGFVETFTLASHRLRATDLGALRAAGFDERDIVDITLCAGYRHYIARVADATGIELDPGLGISPILVDAYGSRPGAGEGDRPADGPGDPDRGNADDGAPDGPWVEAAGPPGDRDVPGLLRALGRRPAAAEALDAFWRLAARGGSPMGEDLEALLGMAVARRLRSPWLRAVYTGRARTGPEPGLEGWSARRPGPARDAVLALADLMTDRASAITGKDVDGLRAAGLDDPEILDVIVATALLNALGRMANALGVPADSRPGAAPAAPGALEGRG